MEELGAENALSLIVTTYKTIAYCTIPPYCSKFSFFVYPSIPYPSSYHSTSSWASWSFQFRFWFHKWYIIFIAIYLIGQRNKEIWSKQPN